MTLQPTSCPIYFYSDPHKEVYDTLYTSIVTVYTSILAAIVAGLAITHIKNLLTAETPRRQTLTLNMPTEERSRRRIISKEIKERFALMMTLPSANQERVESLLNPPTPATHMNKRAKVFGAKLPPLQLSDI